jgi:hypothetical protein
MQVGIALYEHGAKAASSLPLTFVQLVVERLQDVTYCAVRKQVEETLRDKCSTFKFVAINELYDLHLAVVDESQVLPSPEKNLFKVEVELCPPTRSSPSLSTGGVHHPDPPAAAVSTEPASPLTTSGNPEKDLFTSVMEKVIEVLKVIVPKPCEHPSTPSFAPVFNLQGGTGGAGGDSSGNVAHGGSSNGGNSAGGSSTGGNSMGGSISDSANAAGGVATGGAGGSAHGGAGGVSSSVEERANTVPRIARAGSTMFDYVGKTATPAQERKARIASSGQKVPTLAKSVENTPFGKFAHEAFMQLYERGKNMTKESATSQPDILNAWRKMCESINVRVNAHGSSDQQRQERTKIIFESFEAEGGIEVVVNQWLTQVLPSPKPSPDRETLGKRKRLTVEDPLVTTGAGTLQAPTSMGPASAADVARTLSAALRSPASSSALPPPVMQEAQELGSAEAPWCVDLTQSSSSHSSQWDDGLDMPNGEDERGAGATDPAGDGIDSGAGPEVEPAATTHVVPSDPCYPSGFAKNGLVWVLRDAERKELRVWR